MYGEQLHSEVGLLTCFARVKEVEANFLKSPNFLLIDSPRIWGSSADGYVASAIAAAQLRGQLSYCNFLIA